MNRNKYSYLTKLLTALFCLSMGGVSYAGSQVIRHGEQDRIPNHYIVVLRTGLTEDSVRSVINRNISPVNVDFQYNHVFSGFSALLSQDDLNKIMNDPDVVLIEEDAKVSANRVSINETQDNLPSWGLGRIDHPYLP